MNIEYTKTLNIYDTADIVAAGVAASVCADSNADASCADINTIRSVVTDMGVYLK